MKLSLDALKERAEATASTELMETISGGTANACHPKEVGYWERTLNGVLDWVDYWKN